MTDRSRRFYIFPEKCSFMLLYVLQTLQHLFISPLCDNNNTVFVLFYNALGSEWVTIGILPEKYGSADPAAQRGFSSDEPLYNSTARHTGRLEERSGWSCAGTHLS